MPIPSFYDPKNVDKIRLLNIHAIEAEGEKVAKDQGIRPAASDAERICLLIIDAQIDFTHSDGHLYVGGRSGRGAVEDNNRICQFIYNNLEKITRIHPTMDTHTMYQIFFPIFWVDDNGVHPAPSTIITEEDVKLGRWKPNPAVAKEVDASLQWLYKYCRHYTGSLAAAGKYALMIWPYHTMLGEVGHALNPSVMEACCFHAAARKLETGFRTKGGKNLTENYSVLRPEVTVSHDNIVVGELNEKFINDLLENDKIAILGQAKSHCVAWTISDLLEIIAVKDPELAKKVYLVEDCTSSVVIPGVYDFTDEADAAFARFAAAGMHIVKSTTPIDQW
jgi:nicotinamidase-related amidase